MNEITDRLFTIFRVRFRNYMSILIRHMVFIIYGTTILIHM
nr:MAG TPA: hypothetical protein [Caudoviricetes sp.]